MIAHASPVDRITWPDTNDAPVVAVEPRTIAFGSVIAGRSRKTSFQTPRSINSFSTVTSAAAAASRHRRSSSATTTTTGPIARTPRYCTALPHLFERATGNPLIASKTARSTEPTRPLWAIAAQTAKTRPPATSAATSTRRRSKLSDIHPPGRRIGGRRAMTRPARSRDVTRVCSNASRDPEHAGIVAARPDDLHPDREPLRREPARDRDRGTAEHGDAPARLHPIEVGRHRHAGDLGRVFDLDRERRHLRHGLHEDVDIVEERGGAAADIGQQRTRPRHVFLGEHEPGLDIPDHRALDLFAVIREQRSVVRREPLGPQGEERLARAREVWIGGLHATTEVLESGQRRIDDRDHLGLDRHLTGAGGCPGDAQPGEVRRLRRHHRQVGTARHDRQERATSSTVRAIGPSTKRSSWDPPRAPRGRARARDGTRPRCRTRRGCADPPRSLPSAIGTIPLARAAAAPPEEPPALLDGSHGFGRSEHRVERVGARAELGGVVLPSRIAPASRIRATNGSSRTGTLSA